MITLTYILSIIFATATLIFIVRLEIDTYKTKQKLMKELKVKLGHKPKRKPNLVRWFSKHNVSSSICSLNCATMRGIERQHLTD